MSSEQTEAASKPSAAGAPPAMEKVMISSYTILIVITVLVGLATIVLAQFMPDVTAASVSDILVSPISGFLDGIQAPEHLAAQARRLEPVAYGLAASEVRFSHENAHVAELYDAYLERPLSDRAERLLHTDHHGWGMPIG